MLPALLIILFIVTLLEGTITTLPLVLIVLLCGLIINKRRTVFYAAFVSGLLLDIFLLQTPGGSALFLLLFLYLILLYQKKYEINSYPFVAVSSFVGSYLYLFIFGHSNILPLAVISCIIAFVLLAVGRFAKSQGQRKNSYS